MAKYLDGIISLDGLRQVLCRGQTKPATFLAIAEAFERAKDDVNQRMVDRVRQVRSSLEPLAVPPPLTRELGKIPVVGLVQGGPAGPVEGEHPADSDLGEWIARPYDVTDPNAKAARVLGDSMAPAWPQGTVIICSDKEQVVDGDPVVVVDDEHHIWFKFWHPNPDGTVTLKSCNPDYKEVTLRREKILRVRRVVWQRTRRG